MMVDIVAGVTYKKFNGYSWYYVWKYGVKSDRAHNSTYRIKSYRYHHDFVKNVNSKDNARWGGEVYSVITNSLGFRDGINRQVPLQSEKKRLVFLGDSFTEGIGLDYEKTFVGLIGNALKKKYNVLNAGVTSYSPIIYWKKVEYLINTARLEFDELIVYLDISDIQDEASIYKLNTNWFVRAFRGQIGDRDKKPLQSEFRKENTILWAWLRDLTKKEKISVSKESIFNEKKVFTYRDSIDIHRGSWTFNSKAYKEYGERGLNLSSKNMGNLLQLLRQHKIKLTVAIYPWPGQIYYDTIDSKQVLFWENWTSKNNVRFINHFNDFYSLKDQIGAKQLIENYYIPGDVHFNEKGNLLIKESFLNQYPHN